MPIGCFSFENFVILLFMEENVMKRILTIGGSDPFAGGGIQTDLKTFENFGLFGLSALTSIGH